MAKDKKKKGKKSAKTTDSIKALAKNPLVADVVAAALVATASALKDSRRARALASEAGDELAKLSKTGIRQGEALWDMALQIGRRSLEALTSEDSPGASKAKTEPKPKSKPKAPAKPKTKPKAKAKAKAKSASGLKKSGSRKQPATAGKR